MIVSALGLVSSLSQGPAASKKFKDVLPLLLGKYKRIRFYSPWGELPKNQAWDSCSQCHRAEDNPGSIPGQHAGRSPRPISDPPHPLTGELVNFKEEETEAERDLMGLSKVTGFNSRWFET